MRRSAVWRKSARLAGAAVRRSGGHQGKQDGDDAQADERREGAEAQGNHELDAEGRCALFGGPEPFTPHPGGLGIKNGGRRRAGQRGESQGVAKCEYLSGVPLGTSPGSFPIGSDGQRATTGLKELRYSGEAAAATSSRERPMPDPASSMAATNSSIMAGPAVRRFWPAGPDLTCVAGGTWCRPSSTPPLANSRLPHAPSGRDRASAGRQRQQRRNRPQRTLPAPSYRCRPVQRHGSGPAAPASLPGSVTLALPLRRPPAPAWQTRSCRQWSGRLLRQGRPHRAASRRASPAGPRPGRSPARVRAGEATSAA